MIKVPQTRAEIDALINQFPQGSMQREIITKIDTSDLTYRYDSLTDLKFEVNMRANIINSAYALNNSGMDFAVFRDTKCNEEYWNRNSDGGFTLKQGVKASDAIADIFNNGRKYSTECATAMVIVYYKALLDIYPKALFDETFKTITLMNWHYLDANLSEIGQMNAQSDNIPGDRRYFKNPDVDFATPEWQGENTIDLGNGKYYGHGLGIYNAEQIISMLNENRKEGSTQSAFLMDVAGNPNYKRLSGILNRYQPRAGA